MKRWRILRGLVAACFLLLSVLFLFRIQQLRRSELSFTVASQFQGDMDERYVQLSCFWPGEQTTETMEYARAEITAELEQAYGELPAMKMAWGSLSVGVAEIGAHVSAAEVYRVSGDFFSIHPWPQISGSYRYLNNNSAVLNEEAAWDLFASTDCVGLSFSLDGAFYTVHGVCKTPGEGSQIYISGGDASVTFCELLLPEQWDGFSEGVLSCAPALNAGVVYNNTARTRMSSLWSSARSSLRGGTEAMAILFPAWERKIQSVILHLQLVGSALVVILTHMVVSFIQFFLCWNSKKFYLPCSSEERDS